MKSTRLTLFDFYLSTSDRFSKDDRVKKIQLKLLCAWLRHRSSVALWHFTAGLLSQAEREMTGQSFHYSHEPNRYRLAATIVAAVALEAGIVPLASAQQNLPIPNTSCANKMGIILKDSKHQEWVDSNQAAKAQRAEH